MENQYETTFDFSTNRDIEFVNELLQKIDFDSEGIEGSITIRTEQPISLANIVEINTETAGLEELFPESDDVGYDAERSTSQRVEMDDLELDVPIEEVASLQEDSSTPVILTSMLDHDNDWMSLEDVRALCGESDKVNTENLSRLLWSFAESGYLAKRKDGGMNEYTVTDYGKAALLKFNERQEQQTM